MHRGVFPPGTTDSAICCRFVLIVSKNPAMFRMFFDEFAQPGRFMFEAEGKRETAASPQNMAPSLDFSALRQTLGRFA
ncbi:hypothetical protein EV657_1354 [Rhodovulum visakhapatnamense]|uniref:Uncharacterized protein n=1 Tax=Rhodovulum visakhapatnamense TaxID=364297 RepID=A0A4R8FDQ9_9RHOB|nr:hypothetical protein EV657_1354 [Rhodovulum visakhapatnamense]